MKAARFRIVTDDHFAVHGRLADGTAITGKIGYVSNGMSGERAEIVVVPGGKLTLAQGQYDNPSRPVVVEGE